jgi:hypothetical protein
LQNCDEKSHTQKIPQTVADHAKIIPHVQNDGRAVIKYQHKRERVITASRIINIVYVECIKTALSLSHERRISPFASSLLRHICTHTQKRAAKNFSVLALSRALFFCWFRGEGSEIYQTGGEY